MMEFIKKRKKFCVTLAFVSIIIFAIYLYALFLPGYWYGDVFLYKGKNLFEDLEVYSGYDWKNKAEYELTMAKDGMTSYMVFTVNGEERAYEIISDNSESYYPDVAIYENRELVFNGTHDGIYLVTDEGEYFENEDFINIEGFGSWNVPTDKLFPAYNWLYDVSQSVKTEIRGEPVWLICIVIFIAVLILDMSFPDFLWHFHNWIDVKGGEPSEFYRFIQKAGWMISPFVIILFMILSFTEII